MKDSLRRLSTALSSVRYKFNTAERVEPTKSIRTASAMSWGRRPLRRRPPTMEKANRFERGWKLDVIRASSLSEILPSSWPTKGSDGQTMLKRLLPATIDMTNTARFPW